MKFVNLNFGLLLAVASCSANSIIGFGQKTTGGTGGVEYHVNTYKEFREALNNNGNPEGAKIIYIDSPIDGRILDDGSVMTAESLVPGFSFKEYTDCFIEGGYKWSDTDECNKIELLRQQGVPLQGEQTNVNITPNTTIIGNGIDALLEEVSLQVKNISNVIIKNLAMEAPNDLFPYWEPNDGAQGTWFPEYDAITIRNATNVWVDNCYFTDGKKTIDTSPLTFGKYVEFHDGIIDIVVESDDVTISNNRFENHQKALLIGNSDSRTGDLGHLKVTIVNNVFYNCNERLPRVRYGKIHVFNNYYYTESFHPVYPSLTVSNYYHRDNVFPKYFIGNGIESNILSEYNSFNYIGDDKIPASDDVIVYNYGGYIFHDNGSEYNGQKVDIDALAERSFKLKVKNKLADIATSGGKIPAWVNSTFTSETFEPTDYYNYNVNKNLDEVNDLINRVPTWMFNKDENAFSDSEEENVDNLDNEVEEELSDEESTSNAEN
ncbi:pectin lyase-like protein [Neocallimastix californiae]|uniref:Pectin lyase-like protein n=1 Tax=Neocallimastix californiae TaxID=1754190 RepID=A0A1Y2FRG1_9FUNG|nr:pectin lyase-like protein [Neocallimastix californiae]|eukprot:ORY86573.1 pectin lyase-like protein [Neocallimastix californiae]